MSYSLETPNLGQIRQFFEPCDLEIWRMTLKNNRAPLQHYFKLCASFRSHWWNQTGPVFYLISWSPSHLEFFLQVTWSFSIFTPSDLEAKSLSEIPSDFGCWLGDILDHSNIVICILYLSKLIQVTLCGVFYNICTKGSQNSLHW